MSPLVMVRIAFAMIRLAVAPTPMGRTPGFLMPMHNFCIGAVERVDKGVGTVQTPGKLRVCHRGASREMESRLIHMGRQITPGYKLRLTCGFIRRNVYWGLGNRTATVVRRCVRKHFNPLHPKFPAERLAVSSRKNRVRLRTMPPTLALASRGAGLVGRMLDEQQAGRCC